jgi:CheY-like chemotaxis protein
MRRKKILLADDEGSVRIMVSRVLVSEGYDVVAVANGAEALQTIRTSSLDAALLDLNMPTLNGWETFQRIQEEYPLLPVVIITAKPDQFFTSLGAGVGALLEKPLDFEELIETIARLLAEPDDCRVARMEGKPAAFYYAPARIGVVAL